MTAFEGDLSKISLPLTLQRIAGQGATGILTVQGENDIIAVSFLNGGIVSADALNQTVEDGLGEVLVGEGLIEAEAFQRLAAEHQGGGGGTLSELLVERRVITREQLLRALRLQTLRLMLHLLSWSEGELKFYSGDEVSYEEGFLPISVEELLVRAAEERDGGAAADVGAVYRPKPAHRIVRVLDRDGDGSEPGLWLTADEMRLWQACDGERTAVAAAGGLERYKLRYALHRLLKLDLLEPVPFAGAMSQQVGAAEIFMPPDPTVARPAVAARAAAKAAHEGRVAWLPWVGYGLAALAAGLLVAVLVAKPLAILWPAPWQQEQRGIAERRLRQALFQRVDRATRTYYLMEASFPRTLVELVDRRLISPRDLTDPSGRPLRIEAGDERYVLSLQGGDEAAFDARLVEATADDFFLAAERLDVETTGEPPLYLID